VSLHALSERRVIDDFLEKKINKMLKKIVE
jgi:hypothetical protein